MNITIPMACEGDYRLVVSKDKECKQIVHETGLLPNLVLNSGLDLICSGGLTFDLDSPSPTMRALVVGTSNAEPAPGQTSLLNQVASVSLAYADTPFSFSTQYERGYIEMKFSRQFPQGAAAGNISEIGCGRAGNELLSRALVRDAAGNPATITILSDEFLTVHYTLRIFFPKEDITQNINVMVDGVAIPTNVTVRPFGCNRAIFYLMPATEPGTVNGFRTDGALVPPTGLVSPSISITPATTEGYVAGTYKRTSIFSLGTSAAVSNDLTTLIWRSRTQPFQFLFDPPLTKTNQQTMQIRVGFQLGRPA